MTVLYDTTIDVDMPFHALQGGCLLVDVHPINCILRIEGICSE